MSVKTHVDLVVAKLTVQTHVDLVVAKLTVKKHVDLVVAKLTIQKHVDLVVAKLTVKTLVDLNLVGLAQMGSVAALCRSLFALVVSEREHVVTTQRYRLHALFGSKITMAS